MDCRIQIIDHSTSRGAPHGSVLEPSLFPPILTLFMQIRIAIVHCSGVLEYQKIKIQEFIKILNNLIQNTAFILQDDNLIIKTIFDQLNNQVKKDYHLILLFHFLSTFFFVSKQAFYFSPNSSPSFLLPTYLFSLRAYT